MLKKSFTLFEADTLWRVIVLINGTKGGQETLQSKFDTGVHFSYALGRTQNQLHSALTEFEKQKQSISAPLLAIKDQQAKEYKDLLKKVEDEIRSLGNTREEFDVFGWRFSKLKDTCKTIPGAWWWVLDLCRIEEELNWLTSVEEEHSRLIIRNCFLALKSFTMPNKDQTGADFNIGNRVAFKTALNCRSLDGVLVEISKMHRKFTDETKGLKGEEIDKKQKELDEWLAGKEKVKLYKFSIDEIPDDCETIPVDVLNEIAPIIKE